MRLQVVVKMRSEDDDSLFGCLVVWLVIWLFGLLVIWLVGSVGRLMVLLVGWLVSWLVGSFVMWVEVVATCFYFADVFAQQLMVVCEDPSPPRL